MGNETARQEYGKKPKPPKIPRRAPERNPFRQTQNWKFLATYKYVNGITNKASLFPCSLVKRNQIIERQEAPPQYICPSVFFVAPVTFLSLQLVYMRVLGRFHPSFVESQITTLYNHICREKAHYRCSGSTCLCFMGSCCVFGSPAR